MKALEGVKVLDFTHVQSGPTCTQLLAWFGADVIKVERPGVGDATRGQLRDMPDVDSLYFTMLNHNKRSITLNTKNETGKAIFTRLIEECDVMVENFAPGALDRMGFSWERIQEINPRMIYASVKGFGPGPYEDCKVYENVAQCTGGSARTTGFRRRPAAGHRRPDRRFRHRPAPGARHRHRAVPAREDRPRPARELRHAGRRAESVPGQAARPAAPRPRAADGVPAVPATASSARPRRAPATPRGGGQPGWVVKCKGWETDPNAYIYFITQAAVWPAVCEGHRRRGLAGRCRVEHARRRGCHKLKRDLRPDRDSGP